MNQILNVGIIGLGVMGKNHARVISQLDGLELVGIVDPLTEIHSNSEYSNLLMSFEDLIVLKPNYCVISAPTAYHLELAEKLLLLNIDILIEKPLAHNLVSAKEILRLSKNSKSKVAVGHIERFNAAVQLAKLKIESGLLGEIYQVSTSRQGPFPSRIADVGVVLDLATHDIDLTSWLLNKSYKSVSAKITHRAGRKNEDLVSITGTLTDGVVVNHMINWLAPFKERSVVVLGEKGALKINTLDSDLTFFENGQNSSDQPLISHFRGVTQGQELKFAFDKPEPLKVEHINFHNYLNGEKNSIVSIEEGYTVVQIAEAVLKSASESKVVEI